MSTFVFWFFVSYKNSGDIYSIASGGEFTLERTVYFTDHFLSWGSPCGLVTKHPVNNIFGPAFVGLIAMLV